MRTTSILSALAIALLSACEKTPAAPEDSGARDPTAALPAETASATASAAPSAARSSTTPSPAVSMPPRPLPAGSTTVGSGAPPDVQMKAIAYMMALQSPQENDPPADQAWANQLAAQLRPIVTSLDKGSATDKAKDTVEVLAGGRRIDLLMAAGCDAQTPSRAVAGRASTPLPTLVSHGVLVVRCNDNRWQCLQNTRDANDVICTTAPRHK